MTVDLDVDKGKEVNSDASMTVDPELYCSCKCCKLMKTQQERFCCKLKKYSIQMPPGWYFSTIIKIAK